MQTQELLQLELELLPFATPKMSTIRVKGRLVSVFSDSELEDQFLVWLPGYLIDSAEKALTDSSSSVISKADAATWIFGLKPWHPFSFQQCCKWVGRSMRYIEDYQEIARLVVESIEEEIRSEANETEETPKVARPGGNCRIARSPVHEGARFRENPSGTGDATPAVQGAAVPEHGAERALH